MRFGIFLDCGECRKVIDRSSDGGEGAGVLKVTIFAPTVIGYVAWPDALYVRGLASALAKFIRAASAEEAYRKTGAPDNPFTFRDGTPMWQSRITAGKKVYQYVQAVVYRPGCLMDCHGSGDNNLDNHMQREGPGGKWVPAKAGDLAGMVSILLPMKQTNEAIHRNRAILITAALVTAILAMIGRKRLRAIGPLAPTRTIETVQEDVRWIRSRTAELKTRE